MAKKKVKTGLKGLTLPDKIAKATNVVTNSTGKPFLPRVQSELAGLASKATAAQAALNAQSAAEQARLTATSTAHDRELDLDQALTTVGKLVDLDCDGDETKIVASGFVTANAPTPTGPMPQVQNLSATAGDAEGEVDLNWNPIPKNHGYVVQQTADPNNVASWHQVANSTKSKATITGVLPGSKFWFRVAALDTDGHPGPFSNPATALAAI